MEHFRDEILMTGDEHVRSAEFRIGKRPEQSLREADMTITITNRTNPNTHFGVFSLKINTDDVNSGDQYQFAFEAQWQGSSKPTSDSVWCRLDMDYKLTA